MAEMTDCALAARRDDYDRYLTCLFAPASRREALFALLAFNLELAKTAEIASEVMIGQIRLQWWRESIEGIFQGRPRRHYVVEALARAIEAHGLPQDGILALIDTRELDLEEQAPASLLDLEDYAAGTSGQLTRLSLAVLGVEQAEALEAGSALGTAWALLGLCRAIPFHAAQGRILMPRDLINGEGLDSAELLRGRSSPALRRIVAATVGRAGTILEAAAKQYRPALPRGALAPFLLGPLARRYMKILAAAGHDPFEPRVQQPMPGVAWRLLWARATGGY